MARKETWLTAPKRWLIIILLAYIILGIAYSIIIPIAETPDESEHFRYMQAIARFDQLPILQPEREANFTLEAHQPPLYYLLGAAAFDNFDLNPEDNPKENPCFSFEPDDKGRKIAFLHQSDEWPPQKDVYWAFYLTRWVSVLMGAGTVILAYIIGRQVAPEVCWMGTAVAALVAFNPQFIFITSSINNDVPTALLGTAVVVLSISALKRKNSFTFILLGLIIGLGILTKFALIAFWPLAFLAATWSAIQVAHSPVNITVRWADLVGRLAIVIFVPLIIAGWWYWRNFQLYGDPLMWDVTLAAKGSVIARTTPFTMADLGEFLSMHFQSFWMWFGWLNIKAPDWVYLIFLLIFLLAVVGLIRFLVKRNIPVFVPALVMNGLAVLAIYASLLQYIQTINWTGYQGRLAFAAVGPIAVFIALGLAAIGGKKLLFVTGSSLGVLSVAALGTLLLPAYPRPQIYQPDGELTRTCARFQEGLQVEAVKSDNSVLPGETLPVTVYGFGLFDTDQPQTMSLILQGGDNRELGSATADVTWQDGQAMEVEFNVSVVEDANPSRAVLYLAMNDENGGYQAATSATGRHLSLPIPLDTVKVEQNESASFSPMFEKGATFGEKMTLIGYDLVDSTEDQLSVTLYWQVNEKMERDLTTFIHALNEDKQLLAQDDGQPKGGVYPTSIWDVGEIVAEQKILDLSAAGGESDVTLVTGVYLLETMQRLPVWDAAGNPVVNDQLILDVLAP